MLDLQSCYVVKQFLIATGKLLNPDPRRITPGQLRALGLAPLRAGGVLLRPVLGVPARYCYYCSAGFVRTVYTISTCPKYLLYRQKRVYHQPEAVKTVAHAHRRHSTQVVQFRRGLFRQRYSVPRNLCLLDAEDDMSAAATTATATTAVVPHSPTKALLRRSLSSPNFHRDFASKRNSGSLSYQSSIDEDSIEEDSSAGDVIQFCDKLCDNLDRACVCHVLGEDPKYKLTLRRYNTRVRIYGRRTAFSFVPGHVSFALYISRPPRCFFFFFFLAL